MRSGMPTATQAAATGAASSSAASRLASRRRSKSRLKNPEIAGTVVGVMAAVVVIGMAIFHIYRLKQSQAKSVDESVASDSLSDGKSSVEAQSIEVKVVHELEQDRALKELSGDEPMTDYDALEKLRQKQQISELGA